VDIIRDTARYDAYLERTQDFNKFYVKTGFDELDELIGGWDRLEEYATIVARPGVGKSWVLLRCAMSAAEQGLRAGLYSGEMSETKVGYRFDTLAGHISNSGIIHGNSELMNNYKAFLDSMESRFSGTLKVITPKMIKHAATVTDLEAFIEKEKLDILFID
jgi:replicative DNA helicase